MKRTVRTILFIFFVALFAVAAPTIILYAQGYRLNWPPAFGKKLIVKTGGIFVRAIPKQADVYIDNKLVDQTDFFFGATLVENLLPRQYRVEVRKNGYQTWEKLLSVEEKQVTEARNIVLAPDHLDFAAIEKNTGQIYPSPDNKKIVLTAKGDRGWELRLYDIEKNITAQLTEETYFSRKSASLEKVDWEKDSQKINIMVKSGGNSVSYAVDIGRSPAKISQIINTPNATTTLETASIASYQGNGRRYYLDWDGFVLEANGQETPRKINRTPLAIAPGREYRLLAAEGRYFVRQNNELLIFNPVTGSFEPTFADLTGDPRLSPDGKKIAYCSNSEIWVYFLKDKIDQPRMAAGDKLFVTRFSQNLRDCDWLNSDYLIFLGGNRVKTAEIDNRDRINIFDLAKIAEITGTDAPDKNQRMFWDYGSKNLLVYSNQTLYLAKFDR